jgi:hypothetical protein
VVFDISHHGWVGIEPDDVPSPRESKP